MIRRNFLKLLCAVPAVAIVGWPQIPPEPEPTPEEPIALPALTPEQRKLWGQSLWGEAYPPHLYVYNGNGWVQID